jgi:ribose transport system permease protein
MGRSAPAPAPAPVAGRASHAQVGRVAPRLQRAVSVHGLLLLTGGLILVFSLLLPETFPTVTNFQSIVSNQSTVALLALAVMIPMAADEFDLSVGYVLGLTHILAVGLQTRSDVPWVAVVLIVIVAGGFVGLINGLLVTKAHINSFIATLGTGTVVYGISNWYTKGQQIIGDLPNGFLDLNGMRPLGIPVPAFYIIALCLLLWAALEFLPIGRCLYALGANTKAAELAGIPTHRYVIGSFVASGSVVGLAGVLLASRLRVGQADIGPEYLLPAFVGALLGATSVRPGRVNVWGTLIAVLLLAVGVAGIQQLGGAFYVEPLFNGTTLIVAVGLAGFAARRKVRARKAPSEPEPDGTPAAQAPEQLSTP